MSESITTTIGAKMENSITKFEAGKIYTTRSIGDHNCIWNVKVIKRTAKFLTIKVDGESEEKRVGVNVWNGEETCLFSGRYSMAPSIRAGKEKAPDPAPEAQKAEEHDRGMMIFAIRENGIEAPDDLSYEKAVSILRTI